MAPTKASSKEMEDTSVGKSGHSFFPCYNNPWTLAKELLMGLKEQLASKSTPPHVSSSLLEGLPHFPPLTLVSSKFTPPLP